MYTKQEIILRSYREGKSQRSIARDLGISRKTIKKYIRAYEQRLQIKPGECAQATLAAYISEAPVYNGAGRQKQKLTKEAQEVIDKLLEENREKKLQGLGKQLMKKCDIHEQVVAKGFDIGYTTICNYIRSRQAKATRKEAFIRQQYEPGSVCEFDWGEVKLYINEKLKRIQMSVFTAAYSNCRYGDLHEHQDTLAFMESHVDFIDATGGVYRQMVYDNMRVAVAKFVGRHEKEPTQALLQLRGHYLFSHRFCNAYRGNEKGHVERSVEYIRRKAFGVKNRFNSLDEARTWLRFTLSNLNKKLQKTRGKTACQLLEDEQKVLMAAPPKLACCEQIELRVDKYCTVSYRTNRYSVPDHLVGKFVTVKIKSHQIEIYSDGNRVASHERSYQKHAWVIAIGHYLETFRQKPGALAGSVALASSTYLKQLFLAHFQEASREFIELLHYCYTHKISDEQLEKVVNRLHHSGVREITAAKMQALLGNKTDQTPLAKHDPIAQFAKNQLGEQAALLMN